MAKKGSDWKKLGYDIDAKEDELANQLAVEQAFECTVEWVRSQGTENVVKPNPKVNPFWDAKPGRCCWKRRDWIEEVDFQPEQRQVDRSVLCSSLSLTAWMRLLSWH